jgi:hypothetical protein
VTYLYENSGGITRLVEDGNLLPVGRSITVTGCAVGLASPYSVLVGQKKAVAIAVRNMSGRRRWSKLSEWLRPRPPVAWHIGTAG